MVQLKFLFNPRGIVKTYKKKIKIVLLQPFFLLFVFSIHHLFYLIVSRSFSTFLFVNTFSAIPSYHYKIVAQIHLSVSLQ